MIICLAWSGAASSQPVAAQNSVEQSQRTYLPADFARFAPRTAADMVAQVPGFSLEETAERRGFGQGSGNVVINGRRISGKSNDAATELGRIPASRVSRIEIVDGATLDIPGLSGQVANVVVGEGAIKASFEWRPQYRPRIDDARPLAGAVTASGTMGRISFNLGLENQSYGGGGIGPELVTSSDGRLIDVRDEDGTYWGEQPRLSGSLKYADPGGLVVANLNGNLQIVDTTNREASFRSGPGLPDRDRHFRVDTTGWSYELGGDLELPALGGRMKLIGLRSEQSSDQLSFTETRLSDGSREAIRYDTFPNASESILRGEYRWKTGRTDWQFSLEGALNSLTSRVDYAVLQPDGQLVAVPLPNANATVRERRVEAILSYGRPLSPTLSILASAGGEYSNLSQTGAGGLNRTFYRPKGSAALAWKPTPRWDINLTVEREVGQLEFSTFLASVNVIGGGSENSGNPNLVPPQTWNFELETARSLGPLGSVKVLGYYRLVSDIVDQVPIGERGESAGNLDSAKIYGAQLRSTTNFDPLGWRGAKLDLNLEVRDSDVIDPLFGIGRPISVNLRYLIGVQLRQDLPRSDWAYGASYDDRRNYDNFRLRELSNLYVPTGLAAYVEHKDVFGLKARATVGNILGANETYRRAVFVDRRDGPLAFTERRRRSHGPVFTFTLSGNL